MVVESLYNCASFDLVCMHVGKVKVYCNQLGDLLTVEARTLSLEDGQIDAKDLRNGASLFYDKDGYSYPVTVVELLSQTSQSPKKRALEDKENTLLNAKEEVCLWWLYNDFVLNYYHNLSSPQFQSVNKKGKNG